MTFLRKSCSKRPQSRVYPPGARVSIKIVSRIFIAVNLVALFLFIECLSLLKLPFQRQTNENTSSLMSAPDHVNKTFYLIVLLYSGYVQHETPQFPN